MIRLAWWDSFGSRRRLLLLMSSVIFGIASFVGIGSFAENLRAAMDEQAKTLLGSDIRFSRRQAFSDDVEQVLSRVKGERRQETSFTSMVVFPSGESRLAYVSAIEKGFPFYGKVETIPENSFPQLFDDSNIFVDQLLMAQFDLKIGDEVRVGEKSFTLAGILTRIPGETVFREIVAPRVYIPHEYLEETKLLQRGSRLSYRYHYRLAEPSSVESIVETLVPELQSLGVSIETVQERKQNFGQTLENTYRLLSFVWCLALVLAGLGVASGARLYIAGKTDSVGMLRCLGARTRQVLLMYGIQLGITAFFASVVGALIGIGLQRFMPLIFQDALPVTVSVRTQWSFVLSGVMLGALTGLLFALDPIARLRKVSPLSVFRPNEMFQLKGDRWSRIVWAVTAVFTGAFSVWELGNVNRGVLLFLVFAVSFVLLFIFAKTLTFILRRLLRERGPFVLRTGLANIYRPKNQSSVLFVTIGMVALILCLLLQLGIGLSSQIQLTVNEGRANTLLFDIQPEHHEGVRQFLTEQNLPAIADAAVVTMRLVSLKGESVAELQRKTDSKIPAWTLRREYRSTYRSSPAESERLVAGEWVSNWDIEQQPVPISIEDGLAEKMGLRLGDHLEFDIQGIRIQTEIRSIRKVDWKQVHPNFFIVFPKGVIDEAPRFSVIATRTDSPEQAAGFQRSLLQRFPSVSVIDATLILRTVDDILGRLALIVNMLMAIVLLCALTILFAVAVNSREVRSRENLLLRIIGATRWKILQISIAEFSCLGLIAATSGALLGTLSYGVVSKRVFDLLVTPQWGFTVLVILLVSVFTAFIGAIATYGTGRSGPLGTLRQQ